MKINEKYIDEFKLKYLYSNNARFHSLPIGVHDLERPVPRLLF